MPIAADGLMGLAMRFSVKIDCGDYDLGSWSKASGLEVSWDLVEYRCGDIGNRHWYYPGVTKYVTVKLERAVEAKGTAKVREWLDSNSFKHKPQGGTIVLLDAHSDEVTHWDLEHVIPMKWSVVPFDSTANKVAVETLELAHMGFLQDEA